MQRYSQRLQNLVAFNLPLSVILGSSPRMTERVEVMTEWVEMSGAIVCKRSD
ncbi:hypothetical protein FHW17_001531 [Phyllobacterium sp. P30BS-XVII]|nr:hypothetical protein [Phyllobacterium sp. P30BS-XVII]